MDLRLDTPLLRLIGMIQQEEQSFIGSRLKLIPTSQLLKATSTQLLLQAKRQIIRLDITSQTLIYSNIEDEKVLHATYHDILEVYFLLTDKHIIVINNQGQIVKKLLNQQLAGSKFIFIVTMNDGYQGVPNHREDFLMYIKADNLYTSKAKLYYERQLIKNKSICDIGLTIQDSGIVQSPQYIDNSRYFPQASLLILWNSDQTYIYKTPSLWEQSLERLYIYNKISKRQNLSLDYAVSMVYKMLAVGMQSGVIKIFQLDSSRKYLLDLKGHQVACTSLFIPCKNSFLLYSTSPDSTVRIWNLRDYEQVYMLQLDLLVKQIQFVSESLLFVNTDQLKTKSYLCEINTNLLDPIVNDNKSGHLLKMKCDQEWCISIYSNNLIEFTMPNLSQQPLQNQKMQFPLQYGSLVDVFRLERDSYAITLQRGFSLVRFDKKQIRGENFDLKKLVYNESIIRKKEDQFIELIHEKLLDTYLFQVISDWKNIPTAIVVTCVYFHKNSWLPLWSHTSYQKSKPQTMPVVYSVIGNSKGEIYFVSLAKRQNYATKVHFHSESITLIREVTAEDKDVNYFMSVSSDRQLSFWHLRHDQVPATVGTIHYNIEISYLQVFGSYLVVGQKSGEFSIIKIQFERGQLRMRKSTNTIGHLRAVICGDFMKYRYSELFLTGGEDSTIKIWRGLEKQLIFQLKLFGIISTINFIHQRLDLIVCHNEQISFIKQDKLKSLKKADYVLDSQRKITQHDRIQDVSLRSFFLKEVESPISPKKGFLHRGHRYGHMYRKPTILEEKQGQWYKQKQPTQQTVGDIVKINQSAPKLQQLDAKAKIKRFHAFSIEQINSELILPRIKASQPRRNHQPGEIKKDWQIIEELKRMRNRSLSYAGRKKE